MGPLFLHVKSSRQRESHDHPAGRRAPVTHPHQPPAAAHRAPGCRGGRGTAAMLTLLVAEHQGVHLDM